MTVAILIAKPLTCKGYISEISTQKSDPTLTQYPIMYTEKAINIIYLLTKNMLEKRKLTKNKLIAATKLPEIKRNRRPSLSTYNNVMIVNAKLIRPSKNVANIAFLTGANPIEPKITGP
jgi:hypothetical protein